MVKQLLFILLGAALSAALSFLAAPQALAQQDSGMDEVESMFSKDEATSEAAQPQPTPPPPSAAAGQQQKTDGLSDVKQTEIKDVSDLGKLQGFKDIAVISRRFLPKSQRFEAYVAAALNLNDAFFYDFGVQARIGYYFRERYGIEGIGTFLTASNRPVTNELKNNLQVVTTAFVTTQSYFGADFKWVPIYGKMTYNNKKITPFDLYFSLGLGMTGTNQGQSDATFHLGTGQAFAFSKGGALRWDFSWYAFQATSTVNNTSSLYNNLLFTIGWSWFFPEATYR